MRLFIIGLGNQRPVNDFSELLRSGPILARDGVAARNWLSPDDHPDVYDLSSRFDAEPVAAIPGVLIEAISTACEGVDSACYLVPGAANIGDHTVQVLCTTFECEIIPGSLDIPASLGSCSVVDALSLAIAEDARPFDTGLEGIDSARDLVVTNVRGRSVEPPARARLRRIYSRTPDLELNDMAIYHADRELSATTSMAQFEQIIATLRSPEGCPWDQEQTIQSLLPQLQDELEEFEESLNAVSAVDQADELGDVLLHIIMMAQIAYESGDFDINEVVRAISGKMVRRHPHVFADVEIGSIDELHVMWENIKAQERA